MKPRFLLCPPTYFTVAYEINPWMDRKDPVDVRLAKRQFNALVALYRRLGAQIQQIKPIKGLPDMVFTANGAVIREKTALVANFKYKERQQETKYFHSWLATHGYIVKRMSPKAILEGQGEAFFVNGYLFAGYGFRGNTASQKDLAATFDAKIVPLRLIDPRWYHLDTCFCPLKDGAVLYYPRAFDSASRNRIKKYAKQAIAITEKEALDFVCNSVPIGKTLVTGARPSPKTRATLKKIGYRIITTPLTEFKKSGGGARCLTLNLN